MEISVVFACRSAMCNKRCTCLPCANYPSLFGWLVADGWCWFVLREKYCWLVAGGWFVVREKYCWLVADKPSEQGASDLVNGYTMLSSVLTVLHVRRI
jgi:hypothetical protein